MPLFTQQPRPRRNPQEKIVCVIADYPQGRSQVLPYDQQTVLNKGIRSMNVDNVYITSVVKCSHNKAPTKLMQECCEELLRRELESLKPDVIICLGKGPTAIFNVGGKFDAMRMGMFEVTGLAGCVTSLIVTHPLEKVVADISLHSEFFSTFVKAERLCSKVDVEAPQNYSLIESPAELSEYVDKFIRNRAKFALAADIETNGRYLMDPRARMRCVAFSWAKGYAICVPFEDDPEGYLPELQRLFDSEVRMVFHNSVFDMSFMRVVHDIHVKTHLADTMLMAFLLNPGLGKYGYGLKPLSLQYTDLGAYETEVKDVEDDVDEDGNIVVTKWEKAPMDTLSTYNCADVDATLQLYKIFYTSLNSMHMTQVSDMMADACYVICDLQINGVLIDQEFVKDTIPKMDALIEQYDKELTVLAGARYDWNSPKELGKVLYETLKLPNPYGVNYEGYPTDDEALDRINSPFTAVMRKYRKAFKLCSTYFKGYFSKVEEDGRLRADYVLVGTATGRLSSSEPNLWHAGGCKRSLYAGTPN